MGEVIFKYTEGNGKLKVICDTNVWYDIASGDFDVPEDIQLIATTYSLVELATSKKMASHPNFYQETIKKIYDNTGPIIPVSPFDFVLAKHDSNYPVDNSELKNVLADFTKIISSVFEDNIELDDETKKMIIDDCKENRKGSVELADYCNACLIKIRENIKDSVGVKEHKGIDTTELNKELVKGLLLSHVKDKNYTIDFQDFDWTQIELFLVVTELFFRKLELQIEMKIRPNDFVDWLNMLYVTPENQYLTFEKTWRKYILSDDRIKHYLYK